MNSYRFILLCALLVALPLGVVPASGEEEPAVGIVERLGEMVPLETTFLNEQGEEVQLKGYVDKPTILALVYYTCPGICSPLLNGLTKAVDKMDLPEDDYQIVTISFDPNDTPALAKAKKKNYFSTMEEKTDYPPESWRWLTGSKENIAKITEAVGFKYQQEEDGEYTHSGCIYVLSPKGKIIRYLYGTTFLPFDLKMAISEAYKGQPGPTITKLLAYCYSYDPQGRTYTVNLLRIIGTTMSLTALAFFGFLMFGGRGQKEQHS